ncbi:MAG TPA: hypothetical protein ENI77_11600 [Nitrospirae bacterium]|nr:hypothetical protein [Nitrospirota bacterium]
MTRQAAIAVSIAVLGYLLFWAGTWGLANLASLGPRRAMALLERDTGKYNGVAWEGVSDNLLKAHSLNSINADYAYDIGRLNEWRAMGLPVWTREARRYRSRAIEYFRLALTMRPSSSFMWAQLAYSKVLNQEVGKETFDSMDKAIVFGPWEEVARLKVIGMGIALWSTLPAQLKEQLNKIIARSLNHGKQSGRVIDTAVWLGWEGNLRPLITQEHNEKKLRRALKKFNKR